MSDRDSEWGCFTAFRIGKDELAALGALTVATQELEEFVGTSIAWLLSALDDVDAITGDMQFRFKIRMLGAIVLNRIASDENLTERWKDLEKRLNAARDDRNHFVHSTWKQEEWTDGYVTYVEDFEAAKRRSRKEPIVKPADKDSLYAMARTAEKLADELAGFIWDLQPAPSRGR